MEIIIDYFNATNDHKSQMLSDKVVRNIFLNTYAL